MKKIFTLTNVLLITLLVVGLANLSKPNITELVDVTNNYNYYSEPHPDTFHGQGFVLSPNEPMEITVQPYEVVTVFVQEWTIYEAVVLDGETGDITVTSKQGTTSNPTNLYLYKGRNSIVFGNQQPITVELRDIVFWFDELEIDKTIIISNFPEDMGRAYTLSAETAVEVSVVSEDFDPFVMIYDGDGNYIRTVDEDLDDLQRESFTLESGEWIIYIQDFCRRDSFDFNVTARSLTQE